MSSTVTDPPLLTADQLTLIVTSVSCMVFFIVILMLLVALYRRESICCTDGLFSRFTDSPPRYHSRRSLVGCPYDEHGAAFDLQRTPGTRVPGRPYVIGKPNHYHLGGPPPRLPSYESVRKKDRQRRIHSMIAQRFGLDRSQPPPSYEETLRRSVDVSTVDLQSLDSDVNPNIAVPQLS